MLAWERQEGESARAYEAFCLYRDLGPERSLAKVGQELGKSVSLMERWSSEHDWVDRVKALEARDQMLKHDAVEEHLREKAEDHARRETRLREKALEAREKAMEKSLRMLEYPLVEQSRRVEDGPDGEEVVYEFHPTRWSLATAVQLYAMSQGGGPSEAELEETGEIDLSDLSEDELRHLLEAHDKIKWVPPSEAPGGKR